MDTKQIQYLLAYLGYEAEPDGKYGPKTTQAVREFQEEYGGLEVDGKAGNLTQAALRKAVGEGWQRPQKDFWADIQYFTREEFRCPCGRCGGFPVEPEEKLVRIADRVRVHFGNRAPVSSGVRCQEHNDALKGSVPNSRHVRGKAMDFCVEGFSAGMVLDYVRHQKGIRYAYAIDKSYVHMDIG